MGNLVFYDGMILENIVVYVGYLGWERGIMVILGVGVEWKDCRVWD